MIDQRLLDELSAAKVAYKEARQKGLDIAQSLRQATECEAVAHERYRQAITAVEDAV